MIDGAVKVAGTLRVPSAAYPISCNNASLMIRQIRPKADGTWKVPATFQHEDIEAELAHKLDEESKQ